MSAFASGYCSRFVLRLALVGLGAGALAGCASSERLAEAFDNPFQTAAAAPDSTPASPPPAEAAPVKAVQSRPLGAPLAQNVSPAESASKIVAAATPSPAASFGGWTAQGGTPVTVARGDSAEALARRYGIPLEALVRTNGFGSAAEVQPGTRLVVPVYSATLAAANGTKPAPQRIEGPLRATAAAAKAVAPQAKTAAVVPPEPKPGVAAQAPKVLSAATAGLPVVRPTAPAPVKTAEVRPPQAPPPAAAPAARKPEPVKEQPKKVAGMTKPELVQAQALKPAAVAKVETVKTETVKAAKVEPAIVEPKKAVQEQAPVAVQETIAKTNIASESASPEFRWPARGRIIQGFKPGGNDGINIAVPEGTSVKAAENGVVAYAGELKGYGNLVMIRHPNGFVSAYANNGGIEVKRGDNVKRGQVIAKSGQSGDVSSPQLHFELRKGATPVDPTQYLAGL